jgi:hypothetical protein
MLDDGAPSMVSQLAAFLDLVEAKVRDNLGDGHQLDDMLVAHEL